MSDNKYNFDITVRSIEEFNIIKEDFEKLPDIIKNKIIKASYRAGYIHYSIIASETVNVFGTILTILYDEEEIQIITENHVFTTKLNKRGTIKSF